MTVKYDYLVIGAGISGAAAAFELALHGSVFLIEAETTPGYHSTGRSAALYTPNYGSPTVRRLNRASSDFFTNPPVGFCQHPLLTPRGSLVIAAPGEEDLLAPILDQPGPEKAIDQISAAKALELAPILRPERVATAAYEAGVMDIDVAGLHQGFLRGIKARGRVVSCGERIERLDRTDAHWRAVAGKTVVSGRIVVNAAGAWAGQIGEMVNAASIGLVPKRRTAIVVDAPHATNVDAMPAIDFVSGDAYLKPEAHRIMASPGDQTPVEPQDIQPEEWDVAVLVDWLQRETLVTVNRIAHSWAGLRSFVADETPVVGFDAVAPDFFWLAGQGGFGIMMAPVLGRTTAELIVSGDLPADLLKAGVSKNDVSPARLA